MMKVRSNVAYSRLETEESSLSEWPAGAVELRSRGGKAPTASAASTSRAAVGNSNGCSGWQERAVQSSDTLQKLALQYGTTVSELKRVNGFIADQDLFAQSLVRVPAPRIALTDAPASTSVLRADAVEEEADDSSEVGGATRGAGRAAGARVEAAGAHIEQLLRGVDASVERAKTAAVDQEALFNARNGADDANSFQWYEARAPNNGFLERSVLHYLLVILCVCLFIVAPLGFLFYEIFDKPSNRTA